MLCPTPFLSSVRRYSLNVRQSGSPIFPAHSPQYLIMSSTFGSFKGATDMPQLPIRCVVTPCLRVLSHPGKTMAVRSECVCMSMNPGVTNRPLALTTVSQSPFSSLPILAILLPETPMSALYHGLPAPSTMYPPNMPRSYLIGVPGPVSSGNY